MSTFADSATTCRNLRAQVLRLVVRTCALGAMGRAAFLVACSLRGTGTGWAASERTWRDVNELSAEELRVVDLRAETPRDATFP